MAKYRVTGSYVRPGQPIPKSAHRCETLREASEWVVRGGHAGHWCGGQVFDENDVQVASVSVNGRVWEPGSYPQPEITDLDR